MNQPQHVPQIDVIEYRWLRLLIGVIAILFPSILILGQLYFGPLHGEPPDYPSLSAYYCGLMRNAFVGGLTAIGVFLWSYRGDTAGWSICWGRLDFIRDSKRFSWMLRQWTLAIVAGIAALGVAFCPVIYDSTKPWHYTFASVLFAAMAWFSLLFAKETKKDEERVLRWAFWVIAFLMIATVIVIARLLIYFPDQPIRYQESFAIMLFGLAWFLVSRFHIDVATRVAQLSRALASKITNFIRKPRASAPPGGTG